jgi:DNA-binding transcriptional MocR family regulator
MRPLDLAERLGRWSAGGGPLYVLLAARLRTLIDDGELRPGTRLPPDRALARALAVGRSTVVAAYDELGTDGRITRRQGSGTYVAGSPPSPYADARDATGSPTFLHLLEPRRGMIMMACAAPTRPPPELIDACQSSLPQFAAIHDDIGYHPTGHPVLREAVATRFTDRGVPTHPEQVLITSGGQQALSLLARALVRPGDRVLVEVPTYPGALEAFREEGATLRGTPVGMPHLDKDLAEHRPVLAYVIPSHHNPTGAVLPALRRQRLVRAAAETAVTLIDDEVLADLAFPGQQLPPPLASYGDRVVTIGSLSKVV